jgi:hypothetical protein
MDPKTEKANALRAVRREAEKFAAQRERLHAAIVHADQVKVPKLHIANASNLSREWVSQIIKKAAKPSDEQPDPEDA